MPEMKVESGNEEISIIPHSTLESLIYGIEGIEVKYKEIDTKEPGHYAFFCSITDKSRRGVTSIGESCSRTLDTDIGRGYPILMAFKRAFDDAAITFLGLDGKIYSDQQISKPDAAAPPGVTPGVMADDDEEASSAPADTPRAPDTNNMRIRGMRNTAAQNEPDRNTNPAYGNPAPNANTAPQPPGEPAAKQRGRAQRPANSGSDASASTSKSFEGGYGYTYSPSPGSPGKVRVILESGALPEPLPVGAAYMQDAATVAWFAAAMPINDNIDAAVQKVCEGYCRRTGRG